MLKMPATLTYTNDRTSITEDRTSSKGELCDVLGTELLLAAIPRSADRQSLHMLV